MTCQSFEPYSSLLAVEYDKISEGTRFVFLSAPRGKLLMLPTGAAVLKWGVAGAVTKQKKLHSNLSLADILHHFHHLLFPTNEVQWTSKTCLRGSVIIHT